MVGWVFDLGLFDYKIQIKILVPGCNIHRKIRIAELPYTVEIDEKSYKITVAGLWKIKKLFIFHILDRFKLYRGHYLILFREGTKAPIKEVYSKVTPRILKNIKGSTILGKAFAELFKDSFKGARKIGFILFVLIAVIVVYAYMRGLIG